MINLSTNYINKKNLINTSSAWLTLLKVQIGPSAYAYFTNNNTDVTYDSQVYTAYPFVLGTKTESSQGKIIQYDLSISNVGRLLIPYLKAYNGLKGYTITIYIVNSDLLSEIAAITETYDVLSCNYNSKNVNFQLGKANLLNLSFPKKRYKKNFCDWEFKGTACKYVGAETTCNKTLAECQVRTNTGNFGGFSSIPIGSVI